MDTGLGAKAYAIIEQGKIGMILSTRPTDRRQLIEEAAGVTKYKARRRTAALKLEAAQQNLTRIDDIVFEVEKQRGTLKRQAGKARRYQKLRDELRRWEKVLFARRYRLLAETIESARGRLTDAREREAAAAGRVAEVEADLGRLRIELVESESRGDRVPRGRPCVRAEHQHPAAANRVRRGADSDSRRARRGDDGGARHASRPAASRPGRRSPARRAAAAEASAERDRAAAMLASQSDAYDVGAPRHRGARGRRRSGAQRSVFRDQLGDRPPAFARTCGGRPRPCRRNALQAPGRERRRPDRNRAGLRATIPRRPTACAACRQGSRRRASPAPRANRSSRARASSTNGGHARCARANTNWPGSMRG